MSRFAGRPPADFDFENILYRKEDRVATVTINREEALNALDFATLREMAEALRDAMWDDAVAVVVLTGAGRRAFCVGADLKEWGETFIERPRDFYKWMGQFIEVHDRLRRLGKPTIARLNGIVVGGGNEFNLACDLAIAAEHVTLRQIGASRGSVAAAGATQWLPLVVGDRRAREILFLNEEFSAARALEWGWVNEVVPYEELDEAVARLADKLVHKMPASLRYTKEHLNFWRELSWGLTIGHLRDWLTVHSASPEVYEGLRAFGEKRLPDYEALRDAEDPDHRFGPPMRTCLQCGAEGLPAAFDYCGRCGTRLRE